MMAQELIIPQKKELSKQNVYEDFNLSITLGELEEKERSNVIQYLSGIAVGGDVLAGVENIKRFNVEIPSGLLEGVKNGSLSFDKSSKIAGNLTPNIRDLNGNIVGQATIKEGVNPQALTSSVVNLALFAMMAEISAKLDRISDNLHEIQVGQENDRRAKVVSGFVDFYTAYNSNNSEADKRTAAIIAYSKMTEGLDQIHFELANLGNYKEFRMAPKRAIGAVLYGNAGMKRFRDRYSALCNKLIEYQQLSLLTEVVCYYCYGHEAARDRHTKSSNLYKGILEGDHSSELMQRLCFITDTPKDELFVTRFLNEDKHYSALYADRVALKLESDTTELTFKNQRYE